jgi:outer membrane protein assembly factor BamA
LYLDEDNYRTTIGYGDASVNFQYYDELSQSYVDFNTFNDLLFFELQRRIYKRWYLGARYVNRKVKTRYDIEGQPTEPVRESLNNFGVITSHDTRDFIYNPYHGDYMNFKVKFYRDQWGSAYNYTKYEFDFTKFFALSDYKVIAARITALVAAGDVPFEGQYVVGRENIRGYAQGKYRANQAYDVQGEYRWNFYKKWGMVAFGGIAAAVETIDKISWDGLLPGGGLVLLLLPVSGRLPRN